jgi:type II secretory pathway predicted ATPase ExeA
LVHPRVDRMPSMMVIGDTNNGKTRILNRFLKNHPPSQNYGGEKIIAHVVGIEAPPGPSDSGLCGEILKKLYEKIPAQQSADVQRDRVCEVLQKIEAKVLVIDELHNILAGSSKKQQLMLNAIKYLSNTLNISIIGGGTEDLIRAMLVDKQLTNRFTPQKLPLWCEGTEFESLLESYEYILPLRKPSNLISTRLANKILAMSEGTIGEISSLLNAAAIYAIESGDERITAEVLNKCGYVSPSDRKAGK